MPVAPPRRSAAEAFPAPFSNAEAFPANLNAEAIPANLSDAKDIPANSLDAEVIPAPFAPFSDAEIIPPSFSAPEDIGEDIHPQGSSRATGGILRGHAAASYYSPADEENTKFNAIGTAKLIAKIFTSNLDPLNLDRDNMVPSSKVTVKMDPNFGPILENISKRYPAIKGICWFKNMFFF